MIFPEFSVLLPLDRLGSFIWVIAVGFTLPRRRQAKFEAEKAVEPHGRPV
jgi:hypothetical protein